MGNGYFALRILYVTKLAGMGTQTVTEFPLFGSLVGKRFEVMNGKGFESSASTGLSDVAGFDDRALELVA
jgi:hypothetical protein